MSKLKPLGIKVTDLMLVALEREENATGLNRAELIRDYLKTLIKKHGVTVKDIPKKQL